MSNTLRHPVRGSVIYALAAVALFGASTPFAKLLVGRVDPVFLAGLLYLGSGCGLMMWRLLETLRAGKQSYEAPLHRADLPWLAGAVVFGGVVAPVLLKTGLTLTMASTASLLLNAEGVRTALLAWFVFGENFDRRIALGMAAITAGGVLLSWEGGVATGTTWGPLAVAGVCMAQAIDNNLIRKVSAGDSVQIAAIKGLVAGTVNVCIAVTRGAEVPGRWTVLQCAVVGLAGYVVSLTLYVLALRNLGTARTGAYFSVAPFVEAAISMMVLGDRPTVANFVAAALMGVGIWLHLTDRHDHDHDHETMSHDHDHDEYHQHANGPDDQSDEPHTHPHDHALMRHEHPQFLDIHHRYQHPPPAEPSSLSVTEAQAQPGNRATGRGKNLGWKVSDNSV